jgi:hypothetical protein
MYQVEEGGASLDSMQKRQDCFNHLQLTFIDLIPIPIQNYTYFLQIFENLFTNLINKNGYKILNILKYKYLTQIK